MQKKIVYIILNLIYLNCLSINQFSSELTKIVKEYKISSGIIFKNINKSLNLNGHTILMYAAEQNFVNLAEKLLNLNADHLLENNNGLTAYEFAKKTNNRQLIELLKPNDLTIVGFAKFNDGLGRTAIGFLETLSQDLTVDFINSKPDVITKEQIIEKVIDQKILKLLKQNTIKFNKVILFTDLATTNNYIKKLPHYKDRLKISFSVYETTKIPNSWVEDLNNYFDIAIVADDFFIDIYKNCGVKIPVFALPHGVYLDEFLELPKKDLPNKIFTFGCLSTIDNRKNQKMLIDAFINEFKNYESVKLKLNSRCDKRAEAVNKIIKRTKSSNIEISYENLSWKNYIKFMSSLDCYVNISKGEGFSVTPREALALGIPCILTNNTAQKTICDTGYVHSIKSNILEKAYYPNSVGDIGYFFNCNIKDVQKAFRTVYQNYEKYLKKAEQGRIWVQQYRWQNLKNKFLNFIKPKEIILGDKNIVTDDYLMTNSKELYNKYVNLILNKAVNE